MLCDNSDRESLLALVYGATSAKTMRAMPLKEKEKEKEKDKVKLTSNSIN
ncbi:hypothetical protein NBRC116592_00170 [Colwellia sp. KU-HH00111]